MPVDTQQSTTLSLVQSPSDDTKPDVPADDASPAEQQMQQLEQATLELNLDLSALDDPPAQAND